MTMHTSEAVQYVTEHPVQPEQVLNVLTDHGPMSIKEIGYEVRKHLSQEYRLPGLCELVFDQIRAAIVKLRRQGKIGFSTDRTCYRAIEETASQAHAPAATTRKDRQRGYNNRSWQLAGAR